MSLIKELLQVGRERLKDVSDTSALDARILLRQVLNKDDLYLLTHGEEVVEQELKILFLNLWDFHLR